MILQKLKKSNDEPDTPQPKFLVALDIGTEFVKALVAKVAGDQLEIVGVGRARQQLADMQSGAIADIAGVVENCDKALSAAERMAGLDARQTVIGIAGELVKGRTTTVRFKRSEPTKPITVLEMERIIAKVQERAQENARKALAWELGNQEIDVRMVNSALVSIQIDGYKVSNPIGFQGKDVAIQLYTAFAPMIHIGALERTAEELDLELVAVAAEPFAVARSMIGNDASSQLSAILIDVGGGTTDIAVVNDGGVEGTKMFGIGGRAFTRTIAAELDLEFAVAEEAKLRLSKDGQLTAAQKQGVEKAVTRTLDVWLSGIELALSEFTMLDHLPSRILLCGGGSSLPHIQEALNGKEWYKELPFTRKPTVQLIQPNQVAGIVDKTNTVHDHTYITAMGLLRVGLDTVGDAPSAPDSFRERLNKLLSI